MQSHNKISQARVHPWCCAQLATYSSTQEEEETPPLRNSCDPSDTTPKIHKNHNQIPARLRSIFTQTYHSKQVGINHLSPCSKRIIFHPNYILLCNCQQPKVHGNVCLARTRMRALTWLTTNTCSSRTSALPLSLGQDEIKTGYWLSELRHIPTYKHSQHYLRARLVNAQVIYWMLWLSVSLRELQVQDDRTWYLYWP